MSIPRWYYRGHLSQRNGAVSRLCYQWCRALINQTLLGSCLSCTFKEGLCRRQRHSSGICQWESESMERRDYGIQTIHGDRCSRRNASIRHLVGDVSFVLIATADRISMSSTSKVTPNSGLTPCFRQPGLESDTGQSPLESRIRKLNARICNIA
jgi:hypothetical protein